MANGVKTGGRTKGVPNRRTAELAAGMEAGGLMPIDYMASLLRDEAAPPDDRRWAAEKLAPYLHARPAPAQRTVQIDLPPADTAEGVKQAFAKLIAATAAGELTPAEATALAGLIECQRKAIETADILGRLEELEEFRVNAGRTR